MKKAASLNSRKGVVCSHCGCKEHYWKGDKWVYECKKCSFRTTLRSGTVMHGSKLPFRYWFIRLAPVDIDKEEFFSQGHSAIWIGKA